MKILLIKPQRTIPKNFRGIGRIFPSVGLCYIGAVLENNGYKVKILDTAIEGWKKINKRYDGLDYIGLNFKEVEQRIRQEKPDLVGITSLSVDAINARKIAEVVKSVDKNIKVVVGGPHFSVTWQDELKNENIDYVCIGEGEYTMLDLVKSLESGSDLSKVKGLAWKKNEEIKINEPRQWIQNLDELPFPAWHLTNMKEFFKLTKYLQGSHLIPDRHLSIITSRGCCYSCVFCSVKSIQGQIFRPRKPEKVIEEIEYIINKYKIKFVSFEDDNFSLNYKRAEKILDLMIERGINEKLVFDYPNGLRADTLDLNLLTKMKKAGCVHAYISPESGSQRVVNDIIGKKLDLKSVENTAKICNQIGLKLSCFFIVGLPGETKEDLNKTVEFANKLRSYGAIPLCAIARPTFGTDLYKQAKEKGYLLKDGKELERSLVHFESEGVLKTLDFTPEELDEYARKIRGGNEPDEMLSVIKKYPFNVLKLFTLHPKIIAKYLVNK